MTERLATAARAEPPPPLPARGERAGVRGARSIPPHPNPLPRQAGGEGEGSIRASFPLIAALLLTPWPAAPSLALAVLLALGLVTCAGGWRQRKAARP